MENKYLSTNSGLQFLGKRENSEYKKAKFVIIPASYEGTTSHGKGTKNGPRAIIEASYFMEPFDEEVLLDLEEAGIHTLKIQKYPDSSNPKKVINEINSISKQILEDKKFPILIGGEHSLTIGTGQAIAKKYKNISILQIDAHTDLDFPHYNRTHHHATFARTLSETTPIKISQVGIRSCIKEHLDYAKQKNIPIFFAHDIINRKHKISDITNTLKKNVYITLDVDVFCPSLFPHTGTPEPNGLKWQYVINLITQVAKTKHIVGLDLVEHAPPSPNTPHFSDYNAAKLLHKILCIIFKYQSTS